MNYDYPGLMIEGAWAAKWVRGRTQSAHSTDGSFFSFVRDPVCTGEARYASPCRCTVMQWQGNLLIEATGGNNEDF